MKSKGPGLAAIQKAHEFLRDDILETPVWQCHAAELNELGPDFSLCLKMELWQYSGSFKVRAALLTIKSMSEEQRRRGVIAISAGNHAIAVAYAAKKFGVHAKVLMPKTASPVRIDKCKKLGAEVVLMESMEEIFSRIDDIQKVEAKELVHPFDGENVALGTGTLGWELFHQVNRLDVLLMGIGGGGLIGGVANAYKQLQPDIKIIGVEPEGAAVVNMSIKAGKPMTFAPKSIADSLCVPKTEPYPLSLCRQYVDEIAIVDDNAIVQGMCFLFNEMKLAVEPAGAISFAALLGPLRQELAGKKVGIIISGTNIDEKKYCHLIAS